MENKLEIFQEFLEFVRAPGAAMDETEFCEHAGLSEAELQGILDLVAKVEKPDSVFFTFQGDFFYKSRSQWSFPDILENFQNVFHMFFAAVSKTPK